MFKIALINMPFANLQMPSIALTQLKSVVESRFQEQVAVDVLYLNHDCAHYFGKDLYGKILGSAEAQNSGLGDWMFRQAAFPDRANNVSLYLSRYFPLQNAEMNSLKSSILEKRRGLDRFLDSLITKYGLEQVDAVGFTSMFMQNVASFSLARKIKERNPKCVVVMGGANCESPMGQVIAKHVDAVDYVFSGPGLKNFPDFVEHLISGDTYKLGLIKGVFNKKNVIFQSGPDAIGEELPIDVPVDLDYGPFLQTLDQNFPNNEIEPILLFETSRGCWWGERAHCTFCGLNGTTMGYRAMAPELALKQFDSLFQFAPKVTRLDAVDNILPKNYISDVLPYVNTPENVAMFYEVKADLSESDMQVLAKARVKFIQPGIESLATSTLKLMKKGTSAFRNLCLLKFCAIYEVEPGWNLLIGFPGEGEDVYEMYVNNLPLLSHLPPPTGVYPVRFDRYSPYFTKAEEYGLDLQPLDYYPLIYPFPEEELAQLAYYFTDTRIGAEYALAASKWIGRLREKVQRWKNLWSNGGLPPQLFLRQEGNEYVMYDSRSGTAVEYAISDVTARMLRSMEIKPKDLIDLGREFSAVPGFDATKEMAYLQEKGLVFEEKGRFLTVALIAKTEARATTVQTTALAYA
jgi:ribosomal peptide maturation radical SAM protein 1